MVAVDCPLEDDPATVAFDSMETHYSEDNPRHWILMVFLWSVTGVALALEDQSGTGFAAPETFVHPMVQLVLEMNRQSLFAVAIPTLGILAAATDFVVTGLHIRLFLPLDLL